MATLLIARAELLRRIRDRSVLIIGVLAPLGLSLILSLLLGPLEEGAVEISIGVVDQDGTEVAAGLVESIAAIPPASGIEVTTGLDETEARRRVGDDLGAAVVIPEGLGDAVQRGDGVDVEIVGDVDRSLAVEVARSVATGSLQRVRSTTLAVGVLAAAGTGPDELGDAAQRVSVLPAPVTIGDIPAATRLLDASAYYTAAMAVFFVFFTVQIGVTSLLDERREGTMARLLAAPVSRNSILGGKAIASFLLGVASMAILALGAQVAVGADWGPVLPVGLLIVSVVLAAIGIMAVIAGFATTSESAGNLQSIVAVTLGALGGSFFEISGDGPIAQLANLTPHHWFLDGLAQLAGGGGVEVVLPAVGAILGFAAVTGTLGWLRLSRSLSP